jgi:cell wall-associated NlpC family hydrolase
MMSYKTVILILTLIASSLHAERREPSPFLEYEREVARSSVTIEESNPFKNSVSPINKPQPSLPKTSLLPTSTTQKAPIGHDDLPYLIVNQPISPASCSTPTASSEEPKASFISNLQSRKDRLMARAREFLGTPYGFGGKNASQTDCSGFVQQVYTQLGVSLPHSAAGQAQLGERIDVDDLQVGDLLFYQTYKSEPSHVAIYAGERQMIHASYSGRKVQYDSIDKQYYKQRFLYAKRLALKTSDDASE